LGIIYYTYIIYYTLYLSLLLFWLQSVAVWNKSERAKIRLFGFVWFGTVEGRKFTYSFKNEARSHNHCFRGKEINIYYAFWRNAWLVARIGVGGGGWSK